MPVSGDRANFKERRCRSPDPDQNSRHQHDHERHDRVHRNTERATVGIGIRGMDVRYLDHDQKRQEDDAHHSRYP